MDLYLYQFQFIIIGNKGVGKSSLLQSFKDGKFQENMTSTVGLDFVTKVIEIDKHNFKLQLWDTAGQERFRAVVRPYFRNAVGAILVFDITDHGSFAILPDLIDEVRENSIQTDLPYFVLVGNKSDNAAERAVLPTDILQFASTHNIEYIETSVKSQQNVDRVFHVLTRKIYASIQDGSIVVDEQWRGVKKGNELPNKLVQPTLHRRISDVPKDKVKKESCC